MVSDFILACPACNCSSWRLETKHLYCEPCGYSVNLTDHGIVIYSSDALIGCEEYVTRDKKAHSCLEHRKLPTQVTSISTFLSVIPDQFKNEKVLNLGCGSGPSTALLHEHGFNDVTAIDFSMERLKVNKQGLPDDERRWFVRADLNQVDFAPERCGLLMMADFLQHLGDWQDQKHFLVKASNALMKGGRFYLSCFNLNIKNYLRGDIHGSYSNNTIQYTRMHYKEISKLLPDNLVIDEFYPMNIFHSPVMDNLARKIPGAFLLGRMLVVTGRRTL